MLMMSQVEFDEPLQQISDTQKNRIPVLHTIYHLWPHQLFRKIAKAIWLGYKMCFTIVGWEFKLMGVANSGIWWNQGYN